MLVNALNADRPPPHPQTSLIDTVAQLMISHSCHLHCTQNVVQLYKRSSATTEIARVGGNYTFKVTQGH